MPAGIAHCAKIVSANSGIASETGVIRRRRSLPPYRFVWLAAGLAYTGTAGVAQAAQTATMLWFDRPAADWERETLPIGNGAMGATVEGGIHRDRLQFNVKSLWTGGPGSVEGYDFGLPAGPLTSTCTRKPRIPAIVCAATVRARCATSTASSSQGSA